MGDKVEMADGAKEANVEEMLRRMNITEEEDSPVVVEDEENCDTGPLWALAGKVLYNRTLHIDTISGSLRPAWGNPKGLEFSSLGDNMFIATLESGRERDRIWNGSPWMVGKHGVVLKNFEIRARPSDIVFDKMLLWARVLNLPFNLRRPPWVDRIAKKVGDVVKKDVDEKGVAIGADLRVRIWVEVEKPLRRWVKVDNVKEESQEWYDIQYENLPYFCFSCGKIGHAYLVCPTPVERDEAGNLPYGVSLRVPYKKKVGPGLGQMPDQRGKYNSFVPKEPINPFAGVSDSFRAQPSFGHGQQNMRFNAQPGRGVMGRGRTPPKVYRKLDVGVSVTGSGMDDLMGKRAAEGSPIKTITEKRDPKKSRGSEEDENSEMSAESNEKAVVVVQPRLDQ